MNPSRKILVSPSILSADFRNLEREVKTAQDAGADMIHCDVMDGHFVPNITIGPMIVAAVKKCVSIPLDVHLMISHPAQYVRVFAEAGADIITVHAECDDDLVSNLSLIRESGVRVGVTVNPEIPVDLFLPYLDQLNHVLIMTVRAGFGGQKFIPETMGKVQTVYKCINQKNLDIDIEVDGGINEETGRVCVQNGANALAAGQYIFGGDFRQRIAALRRGAQAGLAARTIE